VAAMRRRPVRAALVAMLALGLGAVVTGCQYVDRVAIRWNADGSLDVATCETVHRVRGAVADFYTRTDDAPAVEVFSGDRPDRLAPGDILHFDATPSPARWDRVSVHIEGSGATRVTGLLDRVELARDEWVWVDDTRRCEIDERDPTSSTGWP
jgi:hypothetical protein